MGLAGAGATTGAVASALGVGGAFSVGSFLGTTALGSLLLNVGANALLSAIFKPDAPKFEIEEARVNSRIAVPPRWQAGGSVALGGEAGIFGEHDGDGNFWYIVAHADAEITNDPIYLLDNIEVTLSDGTDGFTAGDVITDDFCLTDDDEQYEGTGTKVPYFRIYTVTPDASNDYGAQPSAFTSAFTLPANFKGVGIAYTIIRCAAVAPEHYNKVMRWRGPIGLGEPSVGIYANFNRMYDPRNGAHDINDSSTWTASTGNSAIVWAWWRTTPFGRNRPMSEINWTKVGEQADICDETVTDRSGQGVPRYRCGVAAKDSRARHEVEQEILNTCAGYVAYDDEGKAHPVVGKFVEPDLTFTKERDIFFSETEVVDDGEQPVDGVIVEYISPDHGYTKQQSAPWQNSNYYDGTSEPNYRVVPILGCQDHNQAVRLAKNLGLQIGPTQRAAFAVNIKGVLAKSQRTVSIAYDSEFSGTYEVVSPVSENPEGSGCSLAVVPIDANRFDLLSGEEGAPAAPTPALNIDDSLAVAASVVVSSNSVAGENGASVRLEATFAAPSRVDRSYRFRYAPTGTTNYEYFIVDMDERFAFSAVVADGQTFDVQWETITAGGRASGYAADVGGGESVLTITARANTTAPGDLTAVSGAGGAGTAGITFTTANDANQASVGIYRGTTTTFGDATELTPVVAGANTTTTISEAGLTAGTYYLWAVPRNGSGVEGTLSGPHTASAT